MQITPLSPIKPELKTKFIVQYENLFSNQLDHSHLNQPNYWEELFLLKVNTRWIFHFVCGKRLTDLQESQEVLHLVFAQALVFLKGDNPMRQAHSLQTLHSFFAGIFQHKFSNFGTEALALICSPDTAQEYFTNLVKAAEAVFLQFPEARGDVLELLLILATASPNLNQNVFIGFIVGAGITKTVYQFVTSPPLSEAFMADALLLLSLLLNHDKYNENTNEFCLHLVGGDNQITLSEIKALESNILQLITNFNGTYSAAAKPASFFRRVSSGIGGYLWGTPAPEPEIGPHSKVKPNHTEGSGLLLVIYELVARNPQIAPILFNVTGADDVPKDVPKFLIELFAYAAYIAPPSQTLESSLPCKLVLLILLKLVENESFLQYIHDPNVTFTVPDIFRDDNHNSIISPHPVPKCFVSHVLDLVHTILNTNVTRHFFPSLLKYCLDIVHKILCYQMKAKIKISYHWQELWETTIKLTRVLTISHKIQQTNQEEVDLANKIVLFFNMFITFGDILLENIADYDKLYYKFLLSKKDFESFIEQIESCDRTETANLHIYNLKMILTHFIEKLDLWTADHKGHTVTADIVLSLIRENYETLTLKLLDNLDQTKPFVENPTEIPFFHETLNYFLEEKRSEIMFYFTSVPTR